MTGKDISRATKLLLVFLTLAGLPASARGKTISVPQDFPAIGPAVEAALDGDTIVVAPGTYSGPENRGITIMGRALSIQSVEGSERTIIDCEGQDGAFIIRSPAADGSLISGFTIRNGKAFQGGAIDLSAGATLTIEDCVLTENTAIIGGAFSCRDPSTTLTLNGCRFSRNRSGEGGAGTSGPGVLSITDCTFEGNESEHGGALVWQAASGSVNSCLFSGNSSLYEGGAILLYGPSTPPFEIRDTTFVENSADEGAAIYIVGSAPQAMNHCTVANNLTRNLSSEGGAIAVESATLTLRDSIVWGNLGPPPRDPFPGYEATHSCIEGPALPSGEGNINSDPMFCGWGERQEVFVDRSVVDPGDGSEGHPYSTLEAALSYSLSLADGSPCRGGGEGGSDMGAPAGACARPGEPRRLVHLGVGEHDIRGSTLVNRASVIGLGEDETTIIGTVRGLRTGEKLSRTMVAGGLESGIVVQNGQEPAIEQCAIVGNSSSFFGGGIACLDSSPTFTDCRITGNLAGTGPSHEGNGGGVWCKRGAPKFLRCRITGNIASRSAGGGVYALDSSPVLESCILSDNTAGFGGGLYCVGSTPLVVNCLFSHDVSLGGGGALYYERSSTSFFNCTMTGNAAQSGAVVLAWNSMTFLTNCILWNNASEPLSFIEGSTATVSHSIVEGSEPWPGEANTNLAPQFVLDGHLDQQGTPSDSSDDLWVEGDYHLQTSSPAIDSGIDYGAPFFDLDGNPRPCGAAADMGVYERCALEGDPRFKRGDANRDGTRDISDAVFTLDALLLDPGLRFGCKKSVDANDDGKLDISDPVYLLNFLFLGGPGLHEPFGECGTDPTPDALGCSSYPPCF